MFYRRNNTFGGDLRATDIQRGRDHGLGTYVATRAACGLPVPNSFHDLLDFISEDVSLMTFFRVRKSGCAPLIRIRDMSVRNNCSTISICDRNSKSIFSRIVIRYRALTFYIV